MPVWASILIAVLSGLGGGLIGTLVKVSEDRKVEVRRATIEATQDFAALATGWFAAVDAAIDEHERELGPHEETRGTANGALQEGLRRLDRLAVLLGPKSDVVQFGSQTLEYLALALDELPGHLAELEPELTGEDEAELEALPDDEHGERYAEILGDLFDEGIAEAKTLHHIALASWGRFAESSHAELHRGLLPRSWSRRGARRGARNERKRHL